MLGLAGPKKSSGANYDEEEDYQRSTFLQLFTKISAQGTDSRAHPESARVSAHHNQLNRSESMPGDSALDIGVGLQPARKGGAFRRLGSLFSSKPKKVDSHG